MANKVLAVKLTGRSCVIRLGDARKSADRPLQGLEFLKRKRLTDAVRSRDKLKECGRGIPVRITVLQAISTSVSVKQQMSQTRAALKTANRYLMPFYQSEQCKVYRVLAIVRNIIRKNKAIARICRIGEAFCAMCFMLRGSLPNDLECDPVDKNRAI